MSEDSVNKSVEGRKPERPSFKGCIFCYTGEMSYYLAKKYIK